MQVVVDDLLVHYQLNGKGRLLLLLHGWGDNAKGLVGLQQFLSRKWQVLALDLPGFGQSQAPKSAWDLDDYTSFMAHFLKKLELDNKLYAAIGHSNGGAVAIRATATDQLKPQKLVLLAASGIRESAAARRIALNIVAKVGNVATLWLPQRYRRALRRSLYSASGSDMLAVEHMKDTFKLTVRQDVQADAAELTLPTLLIYGDEDTATPLSYGQRYHDLIKGSELKVIPGGGHFVHLQQPAEVGLAIEEFLA